MVGVQLHWVGRSEEALKCFGRAMARNPYFPSLLLYFRAPGGLPVGAVSGGRQPAEAAQLAQSGNRLLARRSPHPHDFERMVAGLREVGLPEP
jgi:hypothetical protein